MLRFEGTGVHQSVAPGEVSVAAPAGVVPPTTGATNMTAAMTRHRRSRFMETSICFGMTYRLAAGQGVTKSLDALSLSLGGHESTRRQTARCNKLGLRTTGRM